jgi:hydroxymethylglutaryl-CoA lyase
VDSLPHTVRIREVGPRDGFQNEPETIPTADKVRLIDMLSASGLARIEVTSLVRPDVVPQLADAEQVLAAVQRHDGVSFSVLVPNERGLERALRQRDRFDEVSVFLSASETHNRRNVNRSVEESLAGLEATLAAAGEAGLRREGVIATSFGCPYEGEVPPERVFAIAERLAAAGCEEVGFGDTTGMANPRQVRELFAAARERLGGAGGPGGERGSGVAGGPDGERGSGGAGRVELTAHFHNTRGQGLANVLAALEEGVDSFEASFGELGGCPVPPGSTGNVSSEDVVSMLHEMGIGTGIDLPALVEASRTAQEVLGRPLGAHVLRAGPVDWAGGAE